MSAVVDRITVRERIDSRITASLFANYRSSADAVMELVDNAVDSRLPGRPLRVELAIHPMWIAVMSQGGEGMGPQELERHYLRWGGSPKRGKNLLGQYGQGGKAAIGHLGASFSVEASRPGDPIAWRFNDPNYRDRSRLKTYELQRVDKRTDPALGYVRIRIDQVDKRVDARRLGYRLAETYRPLLEGMTVSLVFNGSSVTPAPLPCQERRDFRIRAGGAFLTGWAGIVDSEKRSADLLPGIRCFKLGRLITQGEFFGHPTSAQAPGMARLIGEIEIPNVPVTMNKSDFDRDSPAWVAIERRVHRLLGPWVKRLMQEDQIPPPAAAIKVAERVRRLLTQALRIADRYDLFPGAARGASSRTVREPQGQHPPLTQREPTAAPKPPEPSEPRRRGFGDIVVRQLDPAVRSQLVIEKGISVVVINSRYPLFLERHGDVWYQLETAAREVCKGGDTASVAEYERRVNEVMLVAFQLRGRKRLARARAIQPKLIS